MYLGRTDDVRVISHALVYSQKMEFVLHPRHPSIGRSGRRWEGRGFGPTFQNFKNKKEERQQQNKIKEKKERKKNK